MNQSLVGKTYQQAESFAVNAQAAAAYADATATDKHRGPPCVDGTVPPMYGTTFSFGALVAPILDPALGAEMMRLVHSEQDMLFCRPVKPGDVITSKSSIAAIEQKTNGEQLVVTITCTNQRAEVVAETKSGLFIRGPRKKGTLEASNAEAVRDEAVWDALPKVFAEDVVVAADQSRRYGEASGDLNPIYLDDDVAKMAGLPAIILHNLCTMAFVHDSLVRKFGPDPMCVKRLAVRFGAPVLMGDRLSIEMRRTGLQQFAFRVKNQLSSVVLGGLAEIAGGV